MTGSPGILSSFHLPKGGHLMDLMDTCRNLVPQYITFADFIEVKKDILKRLRAGERIIYFANHIKTIFSMYNDLSAEFGSAIAFSFSASDRLDLKNKEEKILYDRMKDTENAIAENQELPESIKLLLTTSKNKEMKHTMHISLFLPNTI